MRLKILLIILVSCLLVNVTWATTYFVSQFGSGDGSTVGTPDSVADFNAGVFGALDNDIVRFCGTVTSTISPPDSGADSSNVVTLSGTCTGGTNATVTVSGTGMYLSGDAYIKIENFIFTAGTGKQIWMENSTNNIEVTGSTFSGNTGGSSNACIRSTNGTYIYIHDNTFNALEVATDEASEKDSINFYNTDYGRIIDNAFAEGGGHAFIFVGYGSAYNIVRGNTGTVTNHFSGTFASLDGSVMLGSGDGASYNLIENNTWTRDSGVDASFGIHVSTGSYNIYRKNVHNRTWGNLGISGAPHTYNTIYNNTFYDVSGQSEGFLLFTSGGSPDDKSDDQIVNNIIHTYPDYAVHVYDDANIYSLIFRNNIFYSASYIAHVRYKSTNYDQSDRVFGDGSTFNGNLATEATFTDSVNGDFAPSSGGSQIDAGTYLTLVNDAAGGSGTSLVVDNPYFFFDGYGHTAETGDYIWVNNTGGTADFLAQVTDINYGTKTLTLDASETWEDNAEIYLAYSSTIGIMGDGVDIGANEYDVVISNMSPPDNGTDVNIDATLTWTNPTGATSVTVFFDSTDGTAQVATGSLDTSYDPGGMTVSTEYFWKVNVVHAGGTEVGTVYSFTTASGPPTDPNKKATIGYDSGGGTIKYDSGGMTIQ